MSPSIGNESCKVLGANDACVVLKALSADEKMRMEAEDRLKAWRDEMDRLDGARNEGREEGRQEGREEGIGIGEDRNARNTALLMLQGGEPLEKICRYTGLNEAEIKVLRQ